MIVKIIHHAEHDCPRVAVRLTCYDCGYPATEARYLHESEIPQPTAKLTCVDCGEVMRGYAISASAGQIPKKCPDCSEGNPEQTLERQFTVLIETVHDLEGRLRVLERRMDIVVASRPPR